LPGRPRGSLGRCQWPEARRRRAALSAAASAPAPASFTGVGGWCSMSNCRSATATSLSAAVAPAAPWRWACPRLLSSVTVGSGTVQPWRSSDVDDGDSDAKPGASGRWSICHQHTGLGQRYKVKLCILLPSCGPRCPDTRRQLLGTIVSLVGFELCSRFDSRFDTQMVAVQPVFGPVLPNVLQMA
jgi:hypothetical protein